MDFTRVEIRRPGRKLGRTAATAASAVLIGIGPGVAPANAQERGFGEDAIVLDELVVEGELQTRSLQDTQTSVAVIPGEELERRGDLDLYDVIERTPNVTSSFGEKGFAIRGIDQRGPGAAGSGLLVTTRVDGITLPTNQTTFFGPYSTWDLEQIEVLRGPQSTQQGRNALAGAVIIRSADPTFAADLKTRVDVAERNQFGGAVAFNAPIVDDVLAVRFSAEHIQTDGFVTNPTLGIDDYDNREQTTLRAKALFEPTDAFQAILSTTYARNFGGEDFVETAQFPNRRVNLSNIAAEEGSEFGLFNLRMTYDLNDAFTLRSETSGLLNDYTRIEDFDQTPADGGFLSRDADSHSFEQEVTLAYSSDRIEAVVGGYITGITDNDATSAILPGTFVDPNLPAFVQIDRTTDSTAETLNLALFGEAEIRVLPQMRLIAGGRYDRETVDLEDITVVTTNVPLPIPLPPDDRVSSETTFSAFLPKAGLVYDWTDDLSTGFTVQRGYRAGGTQRNTLTGVINEFDPEFTWNYELALRSQWFDGRLTANANAFYTAWRDQQVNVIGPTGLDADFNTINAGRSRLFGGELELRGTPMAGLELFGSVGFVRTEFLDFVDGDDDFSGNRFPDSSPVTAAFGGTYSFANGIVLGADASYTAGAFSDPDNTATTKSDSRLLLNAQIGYEAENWAVTLYARNLLDNDYVTQITDDRRLARTGEPLTVGAFATLRF
ncbi:MAG: TonB-dependent receptor [Pseudomonadota bacterium]